MDIRVEEASLWNSGHAVLQRFFTAAECRRIRSLYGDASHFRSRIDMKRYRFGSGEYQYFAYPLPDPLASVRASLYEALAPIASRWMDALGIPADFPSEHEAFLHQCHNAGQLRPTPLLLWYREGDYNCLHQDLYGELYFPFQVVVCLSEPGVEFEGGELMLVEQQPRAQSIGRVVPLANIGDAAILTTRYRPAKSTRGGYYRAAVRHGVSAVTRGERYTLGLILHDAT